MGSFCKQQPNASMIMSAPTGPTARKPYRRPRGADVAAAAAAARASEWAAKQRASCQISAFLTTRKVALIFAQTGRPHRAQAGQSNKCRQVNELPAALKLIQSGSSLPRARQPAFLAAQSGHFCGPICAAQFKLVGPNFNLCAIQTICLLWLVQFS